MKFDWKPERKPVAQSSHSRRSRRLAILLLILTVSLAAFLLTNRPAVHETEASVELDSPVPAVPPAPPPEIRQQVVEGTIQPGETMTSLLGEYFTPQQLQNLAVESRKTFPLSGICAGQPYKLCVKGNEFESFVYDIDRDDQLVIRREEEGINVSRVPIAYTVRTETVRGTITSSLFDAVAEIGESPELAMTLADIFAYDIDFIRDIRQGDSFQAVVEKRFRDDTPAGYGRILAAEFSNQGTAYQAFLFKDGDHPAAYYNANGESLRTAFLRAPLHFTRISSGFTLRRFHPIAKTWRAHPAIDYAAPTGTAIMTVGDGTIIRIGRSRYNGNFIKIRHPNGYETMYLHMSRFARGMKKGKRVAQGDVIGYVGATGLATGPHLCFRMTKNGAPINPNRVRTAAAAPISRDHLADFRAAISPLLPQLEGESIQQAKAEATAPEASTTVR